MNGIDTSTGWIRGWRRRDGNSDEQTRLPTTPGAMASLEVNTIDGTYLVDWIGRRPWMDGRLEYPLRHSPKAR